jgi:L-ascorbate metabolism protein UlaG (beta-lactamase superfamily)
MRLMLSASVFFYLITAFAAHAQKKYESDTFDVGDGKKLTITFLGHATLMLDYNGMIIHVDPVGQYADYTKMPKADLILVTHQHQDHLDQKAIAAIQKKETLIILNQASYDVLQQGTVLKNGGKNDVKEIQIEAVPAYNTTPGNEKFHPQGRDNGFVLTIGEKTIYIAGDCEDMPEMASLKNIDIAFLPMNQPYTMKPEQFVHAVQMIKPKIVYPYHYGKTDVSVLPGLMKGMGYTELRIRQLQ